MVRFDCGTCILRVVSGAGRPVPPLSNFSATNSHLRSHSLHRHNPNSRHMKTVGIIGGIGPESTIEYYRFIIAGYRQRKESGTGVPPVNNHAQDPRATSYPSVIINSIDLNRLIAWMNANELDSAARYLSHEIERLARAGADF